MRVLHLNAGNETGGGMFHILSLLSKFPKEEVVLGVFEEGELYHKAKEKGINTIMFKQRHQGDLSILSELTRYIRDHNFNFIHTHGPRAAFLMALIKKQISQPLITTIHSSPCDDFKGKGIKGWVCHQLHKWSFKYVDHFLVVSNNFSNLMQKKYKVPQEKISVVLNGLNFDDSYEGYNREDFGLNESDFIIMMVARLEPVKQHKMAIEAFRQFNMDNPSSKLILVGDGSEQEKISSLIEKFNLDNHVWMLGRRNDVNRLYGLSDIVLLTSKSESFPLVLLEAARAKVPVVTTNVGDVKTLIPTKDHGWIVESDQHEAFVKTFNEAHLLKNRNKLSNNGERLYDFASKHFSLEKFYENTKRIYKSIRLN
ncbi:glycosyltransferase involved in cell wall biosynthesis [Alkalibacillus filiformis]|uniref:Glycosyltransferase involved in cell wall biosynthesis n=1 Tax=Alkalibacillus filiformis TaxID=200990 RepID=A0ABU0DWM8_9BACI|nr:glycosyltransferase family 4 protein [Alkalibacillus filiformis]MDQ0352775.1 glycosyltransferase involved in cell wall biosynthesis [Alkalibacillus filiformis]